jgi:hypothetical protein
MPEADSNARRPTRRERKEARRRAVMKIEDAAMPKADSDARRPTRRERKEARRRAVMKTEDAAFEPPSVTIPRAGLRRSP